MDAGNGFLFALPFTILGILSGLLRTNKGELVPVMLINAAADFVILFLVDSMLFYGARPMMTIIGLWPMLLLNLFITAIVASGADFAIKQEGIRDSLKIWRKTGQWRKRDFSPVDIVAWVLVVAVGVTWIVGHNSGHHAYKASHMVSVTMEPGDALPPSSTTNMPFVPEDVATTRASGALQNGVARAKNYSTYLELAKPVKQWVAGHMQWVFPLQFDGIGNKKKLDGIEPGYIMVPAEDVNGTIVEHYDGQYGMKVSVGGGQGLEPARWAYDHGYSGYQLDDPTLEIDDQGNPWFTVTLLRPQLGWTFDAPVGVLLINAHTGAITKYNLDNVPDWVDRVYSSQLSERIANWFGSYNKAGFKGPGSSNANRYQVSGDPLLVYTGGPHPDWRMEMTSFNKDASVAYIVIMDAHTGAMHVYSPQGSMSTEPTVYAAFNSASGQGAGIVNANHFVAEDISIHVLYGHVTFMVAYVSQAQPRSFAGVGFLDAYHSVAANAVFGNTLNQALSNYLIQLGVERNVSGSTASASAQDVTLTGTVVNIQWDLPAGGAKLWYFMLAGDNQHVYAAPAAISPAVIFAKVGDHISIDYLSVSPTDSTRTVQTFRDDQMPLRPIGS